MSAAAALPRDSPNVSNNAAKLKTNNALTTEFFFDTGATNFEATEVTPSKDGDARKSRERAPHSSLLATPLNRTAGGQVKMKPSPSILESKYLSKPATGALGRSSYSSPAARAAPLSAGKGTPVSPLSYKTPLSKKFTTAATTSTSPSASLVTASSDIKARLRQLAATTPITDGGATPTTSGKSARSYYARTPMSTSKDFLISAAATTGGSRSSSFTPNSAESLAARSRANQMQAELQLRELEVHKLATAAAEARKERDEQKMRADKLEAIASSTRRSPPPFYQIPQQAQRAFASPSSTTTKTTPISPPREAQAAVSELRREAETLRQQVEMAASELQGQRARADTAEERARYAEARAEAGSSASEASENELRSLRQKVGSLQNEIRRLATDLAIAEDRAGLAESSLIEERNRSRGGTGTGNGNNSVNNSAALTEVALTAQVRALATQLKVAKTEAATFQQELNALKAETQGHAAVHEGTTASILSENRELEAALAQASQNLEERSGELEQARGAVVRLAAENAALHAALKDRDEQYAALEYRYNTANNSEGSSARSNAAEAQLTATQQELKASKTRIANLEHAMSKNTKGANNNTNSTGPSPLRDIVGSLRTELEDRELRLAAAEEELATERRRAHDLHRQVLDQAVEIDDLQRETHHQGDDILRKELEQARREAHAAAVELAEVRQQQQNQNAAASPSGETAAEVEVIKQLREELDSRESEVMALQGQLNMLLSMNNGRGVAGGDGVGEVENWLTGP